MVRMLQCKPKRLVRKIRRKGMPMTSEAFSRYEKRTNQRIGLAVLKNGYHRLETMFRFFFWTQLVFKYLHFLDG
jgi:hypothetical protein